MATKKKEQSKDIFGNYYDPSKTYKALEEASLLPQWAKVQPSIEDTRGAFYPQFNYLIAKEPSYYWKTPNQYKGDTSLLSHELTHAAQNNLLSTMVFKILDKQEKGIEVTPQEKQFLSAMQKFSGKAYNSKNTKLEEQVSKDYKNVINSLYKKKANSNFDTYRTTPIEAQAHGVESMTKGGLHRSEDDPYSYNPHMDPSFATQFDILLSMYQQLPKELRKETAQAKKELIDKTRKSGMKNQIPDYPFENMFADPFASTIK